MSHVRQQDVELILLSAKTEDVLRSLSGKSFDFIRSSQRRHWRCSWKRGGRTWSCQRRCRARQTQLLGRRAALAHLDFTICVVEADSTSCDCPVLPPLLTEHTHVLGFVPAAETTPMLEVPQAPHVALEVGLRATAKFAANHTAIHPDMSCFQEVGDQACSSAHHSDPMLFPLHVRPDSPISTIRSGVGDGSHNLNPLALALIR
mmetsp:Transcript_72724/g.115424  ORF Transcript_72724/g.115424 Transcript_72724/m.115424 type:complete len:204 (-) Transcript_72724:78-689(-)